jgi:hypothetical protein
LKSEEKERKNSCAEPKAGTTSSKREEKAMLVRGRVHEILASIERFMNESKVRTFSDNLGRPYTVYRNPSEAELDSLRMDAEVTTKNPNLRYVANLEDKKVWLWPAASDMHSTVFRNIGKSMRPYEFPYACGEIKVDAFQGGKAITGKPDCFLSKLNMEDAKKVADGKTKLGWMSKFGLDQKVILQVVKDNVAKVERGTMFVARGFG